MNDFQPVGPFKEGDPLTIMCVATGGEPPPSVLWYKENQIIDRSFIVENNNKQTEKQKNKQTTNINARQLTK